MLVHGFILFDCIGVEFKVYLNSNRLGCSLEKKKRKGNRKPHLDSNPPGSPATQPAGPPFLFPHGPHLGPFLFPHFSGPVYLPAGPLPHPATVQRSAQLAPRSPQPSASRLACVRAMPLTSRARLSAPAVTRRPRPPRAADAPTPLVIPFLSPPVFLAALPALLRPARFASVPWTKSRLSTSRTR